MLGDGEVLGDSIVALVAGAVGMLCDDVDADELVLIVAVAAVLAVGAADCVVCFEHAPSASTPSASAPTARICFIVRVPLYGLIIILNSLSFIYNDLDSQSGKKSLASPLGKARCQPDERTGQVRVPRSAYLATGLPRGIISGRTV